MPKISIIVPVYGVERYLKRCIDSLINQTFKDIEIILVDDKSPDKCPDMCDEYALKDKRIQVIHKEQNEGLGFARNTGLEFAKGEYITFVDSDDWVETDTYNIVLDECTSNNLDICFFRHRRVDDNGISYQDIFDKSILDFFTNEDAKQVLLNMIDNTTHKTSNIFCSVCCAVYKKTIIDKLKFHSERDMASEDLLFHLELLPNVSRIRILPNVLYNYYFNSNSISTTFGQKKLNRMIKLLDYLKTELPIIFPNGEYKDSLTGYILMTFKVILRFESWSNISLLAKRKRIKDVCSMEICQLLYSSSTVKKYSMKDKLIVFCMKYRISLFFIILYNVIYNKYGIKK